MARILAIDYGLSRVGLAISDSMGILADPYKTLRYDGDDRLASEICEICMEENVAKIVIGNPVHFSGDDSEISQKVRAFAKILRDMDFAEVIIFDERLTSKRAKQIMHNKGEQPSRNKSRLNAIAAAVILNDYLEKRDSP